LRGASEVVVPKCSGQNTYLIASMIVVSDNQMTLRLTPSGYNLINKQEPGIGGVAWLAAGHLPSFRSPARIAKRTITSSRLRQDRKPAPKMWLVEGVVIRFRGVRASSSSSTSCCGMADADERGERSVFSGGVMPRKRPKLAVLADRIAETRRIEARQAQLMKLQTSGQSTTSTAGRRPGPATERAVTIASVPTGKPFQRGVVPLSS
jgi:hypothetical protein